MWKLYFGCLINHDIGFTTFYLLPTIEYFRDKVFDKDGDCSFNLSFEWLFWCITITRYWGSRYENK